MNNPFNLKEGYPMLQKSWQGIKFSDLKIKLSKSKLPSAKFYKLFYVKLRGKYNKYSDFDTIWLQDKEEISKVLLNEIGFGKTVLSYGCGIGYVEFLLANSNHNLKIDCYDFAINYDNFIDEFEKPENLTFEIDMKEYSGKKYQIIYLCNICYAMNKKNCEKLLKNLKEFLTDYGKIIIIHHPSKINLYSYLKFILKSLLPKPFLLKYYQFKKIHHNDLQFWGYSRSDKIYENIAKKVHLKMEKKYFDYPNSYLFFSKV